MPSKAVPLTKSGIITSDLKPEQYQTLEKLFENYVFDLMLFSVMNEKFKWHNYEQDHKSTP